MKYTVTERTRKEPGSTRPEPPLWLDAVRRFERLIGVPVERLVTSDAYFDAMPKLRRAQAQVADLVASFTEDWFRLLNLPAGSDVRRMREQLSRMERQLEKLTKELAARQDGGRPAARKRDAAP
ncbi:MAG TPA: hypothetical protein VGJ25_07075 [Gaiellaceae bacterium]